MSYYRAPALDQLVADVNDRWPNRDKGSDGWIGDTSHQARPSDHNPDYSDGGIVRAQDIDNDGIDREWLVQWLINDPRTAYVITKGQIWQNPAVYKNGGWRKYTGSNPHNHHVHISVRHGSFQNDKSPWLPLVGENEDKANEGDWSDMASKEEIEDIVRRVSAETSKAQADRVIKELQRIGSRLKDMINAPAYVRSVIRNLKRREPTESEVDEYQLTVYRDTQRTLPDVKAEIQAGE